MVRSLRVAIAGLSLSLMSAPASAVLFSFTAEFSGTGATCANATCATLSAVQDGSDVDFLLTANLTGPEKITNLYGNKDPFDGLLPTDFANVGGTYITVDGGTAAAAVRGADETNAAFKADGDGYFDWRWDFNTSDPTLNGSDTFAWTILDASLESIVDAISVNGSPGKNGFTFAMHVQGLGARGGLSGWFYAVREDGGGGETEIPAPSVLALVGLGLGMIRLRRRRKAA